jgi:DNA-binding NarL/FixJ family response regulator
LARSDAFLKYRYQIGNFPPVFGRCKGLILYKNQPTMSQVRVIIADDHEIFREGLRHTLAGIPGIEVIGEASNGRELLFLPNLDMADIVLMDVRMPLMDGVEASRELMRHHPGVRVIALSMSYGTEYLEELLDAGVDSFLLKNTGADELREALFTVAEGQAYVAFNPKSGLFQ